mgnify:CR=1 FL=1
MNVCQNSLNSFALSCILAGQANLFTGCNDDMPAESYYTFTGEMMSDFLIEHENFCLFKRIAERAGKNGLFRKPWLTHLLSRDQCGRGSFPERERICICGRHPASFCDTLLRACIIERIMYTYDLPEIATGKQRTGLTTHLRKQGRYVDANQMALTIVNRRAASHQRIENDSWKTAWYIRLTVSWYPAPV